MMISAAAATGTPATWTNTKLASATVTFSHGDRVNVSHPHAAPLKRDGAVVPGYEQTFIPAGNSFTDAVSQARELAAASANATTRAAAHGVLQASDGAYFLTALQSPESGRFVVIDGMRGDGFPRISVVPHTGDLKAIVGATDLIDLRPARQFPHA
ncbi:MAG: hypothetical protein ABI200_06505 [Gaiellales bacterium]